MPELSTVAARQEYLGACTAALGDEAEQEGPARRPAGRGGFLFEGQLSSGEERAAARPADMLEAMLARAMAGGEAGLLDAGALQAGAEGEEQGAAPASRMWRCGKEGVACGGGRGALPVALPSWPPKWWAPTWQ